MFLFVYVFLFCIYLLNESKCMKDSIDSSFECVELYKVGVWLHPSFFLWYRGIHDDWVTVASLFSSLPSLEKMRSIKIRRESWCFCFTGLAVFDSTLERVCRIISSSSKRRRLQVFLFCVRTNVRSRSEPSLQMMMQTKQTWLPQLMTELHKKIAFPLSRVPQNRLLFHPLNSFVIFKLRRMYNTFLIRVGANERCLL